MLCSAHFEQICNTNKTEKLSTWSRKLEFGLNCRAELIWAEQSLSNWEPILEPMYVTQTCALLLKVV